MSFGISYDNLQVEKYVSNLSVKEKVDYYRILDKMSIGKIEEVNAKKWRNKIFEVYFKNNNRLFYVIENGVIFLMYACKKTKSKTTSKDSKNIMSLYKHHKKIMADKISQKDV